MGLKCHISDEIKEAVRQKKTVMGAILGGSTKYLQTVDVSINLKQLLESCTTNGFEKESSNTP